jgi:hypothetical protein
MHDWRGQSVRRVGVFERPEGFLQCLGDVVGITLGGLGPFGYLRAFAADAYLLGGQHFFVRRFDVGNVTDIPVLAS